MKIKVCFEIKKNIHFERKNVANARGKFFENIFLKI